MPSSNFPRLKTIDFKPVEFKPIGYTPQPEDTSIMERSLEKMEKRRITAYTQQSAVDVALKDIESKLNSSESDWFAEYKNDIRKQIQDQIDAGNYGDAITVGLKLAGDVQQDTRLIGRINANAKYEQYQKDLKTLLDTGKISGDTFTYLTDKNTYHYNEYQNESGKWVQGQDWAPEIVNQGEFILDDFIAAADKQVTEDKGGTTTTRGGTTTNANGTGSSYRTETSKSYTTKDKENILKSMREMLNGANIYTAQVQQRFEVEKHAVNKLKERLDAFESEHRAKGDFYNPDIQKQYNDLNQQYTSRKQGISLNGPIMSYNDYVDNVIINEAKAELKSFDWQITSDTQISSKDDHVTGTGEDSEKYGLTFPSYGNNGNINTYTYSGPPVGITPTLRGLVDFTWNTDVTNSRFKSTDSKSTGK